MNPDTLREALEAFLATADEESGTIDISPQPTCNICTGGQTPRSHDRGLCAYHTLRAALAGDAEGPNPAASEDTYHGGAVFQSIRELNAAVNQGLAKPPPAPQAGEPVEAAGAAYKCTRCGAEYSEFHILNGCSHCYGSNCLERIQPTPPEPVDLDGWPTIERPPDEFMDGLLAQEAAEAPPAQVAAGWIPWDFNSRPRHLVWVYKKGYITDRLITAWRDDGVETGDYAKISYEELFDKWIRRDGKTPCGRTDPLPTEVKGEETDEQPPPATGAEDAFQDHYAAMGYPGIDVVVTHWSQDAFRAAQRGTWHAALAWARGEVDNQKDIELSVLRQRVTALEGALRKYYENDGIDRTRFHGALLLDAHREAAALLSPPDASERQKDGGGHADQ